MTTVYDQSGNALTLEYKIGEGGEGSVYAIREQSDRVAKIYRSALSNDQLEKLTVMIESGDAPLRRVATWPEALIGDGQRIVGFTMPKLTSLYPLHELFGPRSRREHFPNAHWKFLIHTAMNVARGFATMHERDIVVGDVNSNNVIVHETSKARFIDCDSFQIRRADRLYSCGVGVPEYQPPEFQGRDLRQLERLPEHDRFGLAIMIFQLLFLGKHPFAGVLPLQFRDQGGIGENIIAGRFFYAPDAGERGIRPPPGSLSLAALPDSMVALFIAAFLGAPDERPTADAWLEALVALERTTVTCERNSAHRYAPDRECPWCTLEGRGLQYFPNSEPHELPPVDTSIWRRIGNSEIERWQAALAAVTPPAILTDAFSHTAARQTPLRLWKQWQRVLYGVGVGVFLVGVVFALLGLVKIAAVAMALAGLIVAAVARPDARAAVKMRSENLTQARAEYLHVWTAWRQAASGEAFFRERARLEGIARVLLGQADERSAAFKYALVAQYEADLQIYLRTHLVPNVLQVPGSLVTPSGPTTGVDRRIRSLLAQYGIVTAADVTYGALMQVPHLRSWPIDALLEWRTRLEANFRALPPRELDTAKRNEIERQFARAREEMSADLATGPQRLEALVQEITADQARLGQEMPFVLARSRQAEADMRISPFFYRFPLL